MTLTQQDTTGNEKFVFEQILIVIKVQPKFINGQSIKFNQFCLSA
jgi:hypothetical protein